MYLQVIGSGDAFGSGGRNTACFLLGGESGTVLLDCGASSLPALKRCGVRPADIDAVLISHLHGDHFGGVPFLFLEARYLDPRERPLQVAGPPGVGSRMAELGRALYRAGGAAPEPSIVQFQDLEPGRPCRVGPAVVHPFAVKHVSDETCLGLRVEMGGKTVVYTGDTRWFPGLMEAARDADLFLWECTNTEDEVGGHTRLADVLEHAGRLESRRLLLTHLGPEVLAARDDHDLPWAEDGMRVEL